MSFNPNRFTVRAQEIIQSALEIAQNYSNQVVEPEHLLAALVQDSGKLAVNIINKVGGNADRIKIEINSLLERLPKVTGAGFQNLQISHSLAQLFDAADAEAKKLKDEYISTDHILLALVREKGKSGDLLRTEGLTTDSVLKALKEVRGSRKVDNQNAEDSYQSLKKFGKDLNDLVRRGKLDPVIGRDEEIRRVLQVLSRRTKNNPVLIGEPGVGKTAIAEGIAQRIVAGDVPENLKSKTIVALDLGALIAGTQFRGQFEERMKAVLKEVQDAGGEIVLFIDELHTLVGAGSSQGSMDAANILKPALARGELHCIGATTLDEYRQHIEKDSALERRFQPVPVSEPNEEDAISILRGLKERYEVHHGVRITDNAIVAAVQLSTRYIADRYLPDKAIDLIDEAASKLRMEIDSLPEELDALERKVKQYEIERVALQREKDPDSAKRLTEIEQELASVTEERNTMKMHLNREREKIQSIRTIKSNIEQLRTEAEQLEREGDFGKVAEIRYGRIVALEKQLNEETKDLLKIQQVKKMLKEEVETEDVAEVVAKWTGIPVTRMLESERSKLLRLEDELHLRVVGQDEAVSAVANAIRRSRAGLQDAEKPIGSFIFLGTTGVGKTELARALASSLFDDEHAMIRIDMSEYMEKHAVSRLIGAPPGYVGFEEGGQLTEAVRRRPYSVILLDEIEKAHRDVFNILLQVLDDGRLTDNRGRTVNFKNTIIIMTSNLGSDIIQEKLQLVEGDDIDGVLGEIRSDLSELLRKTIRPEFLNRIDDIILFKPLRKKEIRQIVDLQLARLVKQLEENDVHLIADDEVKDWLAQIGYDVSFGARPLKRTIQKYLVNPLSQAILGKATVKDETITCTLGDTGRIVFTRS